MLRARRSCRRVSRPSDVELIPCSISLQHYVMIIWLNPITDCAARLQIPLVVLCSLRSPFFFRFSANTLVVVVATPDGGALGDHPTDYQTFNVGVHTNLIRLVPKFQKYDQWIGIKEV